MTAQLLYRGYCDTRQTLPFPSGLLVLSVPSPEWLHSFLTFREETKCLMCCSIALPGQKSLRSAALPSAASTEKVMTIHKGNTVLWAEDGGATIKWECHGLGGGGHEGWNGEYKWVI